MLLWDNHAHRYKLFYKINELKYVIFFMSRISVILNAIIKINIMSNVSFFSYFFETTNIALEIITIFIAINHLASYKYKWIVQPFGRISLARSDCNYGTIS